MAVQWKGDKVTANAAADLSALQYRIGYVDTTGKIAAATSSNAGIVGVITEPGKSGKQATLTVEGIQKVACAGTATYNVGDKVQVDGSSRAVAHVAPTANTSTGVITSADVFGVVLVGGTSLAADTLITVKLVNSKV